MTRDARADPQFEAIRLLGQWSILARHFAAGGCSCCPGYVDADAAQIEHSMLNDLVNRHPVLAGSGGLSDLLRTLAFPPGGAAPGHRDAVLDDVARMFEMLERARLGL